MPPRRETYLDLSKRPVYALLLVGPLLAAYEVGAWQEQRGLLAEQALRGLLTLRDRNFHFLSGVFVLAVITAWQIAGRHSWSVRPSVAVLMVLESVVLTLPLFLLHAVLPRQLDRAEAPPPMPPVVLARAEVPPPPAPPWKGGEQDPVTPPCPPCEGGDDGAGARGMQFAKLAAHAAGQPTSADPGHPAAPSHPRSADARRPPPPSPSYPAANADTLWRDIVVSLGAGPYEELIFRLFLVELLLWLQIRLLGSPPGSAVLPAILISATMFSAYHFLPGAGEPFTWGKFLFRTGAGVYFSAVFVMRGYTVAAVTHTGYDVLVDLARRF